MIDVDFDCPNSKDGFGHCPHWDDCDPCCWCGDNTEDLNCDCDAHERNRKANPTPQ